MIGQELNGRYEIISPLGGGGMALVYKAKDTLLNRFVAVKVLRQQFMHDEEFIRRFQREAQSAASLSHPNVVSIYDVGRSGDIHYIIMEYVEGHNLNEIIKERAPLQVEEAVRIASQICEALEHAHANQIIHRDIKPHNILMGKNGRIKVTDFGIARAVTSSTITHTGSVVGSVHYFSPEHAKGVMIGEKSDLYSLGIVLYQMLTGKVPFSGDSPISVALKHLQEQVEEPRKLNPHIPQSVENVILKALRKNPEHRYQSASEMLADLRTCLDPDRLNEPKVHYQEEDVSDEETKVISALRVGADRENPVGRRMEGDTSRSPLKSRRWMRPAAWIAASFMLVLTMWFGIQGLQAMLYAPEVDVPNVINLPLEQAKEKLAEAGLEVEEPVIYQYRDDVPENIVFNQDKRDTRVKVGTPIKLYVSKGPEEKEMPTFIGKDIKEAEAELFSLGIKKGQISTQYVHSEAPSGTVIEQNPLPGESYRPKEAHVELTVSSGRETVTMPNLIGKTESEARAEIIRHNLKLAPDGVVYQPSYSPKGVVFKQFPFEPGQPAYPNQEITIFVSSGYPEDTVEYTLDVPIHLSESDKKKVKVSIVVNDARGDEIEVLKDKKISEPVIIPVNLVLSKSKDATVHVYKNGKLDDILTVTYKQVMGN